MPRGNPEVTEHTAQYYQIPKTGATWGLDMPTQHKLIWYYYVLH